MCACVHVFSIYVCIFLEYLKEKHPKPAQSRTENTWDSPNDCCGSADTGGVFHLRSPAGKYKMNFSEADAACQAEGATLATFKQLGDAQQVKKCSIWICDSLLLVTINIIF